MPFYSQYIKFKELLLYVWAKRPYWLRILLALSVGIAFLINDYQTDFDLRFKLRGTIQTNEEIVLLLISEDEWSALKKTPIDSFQVIKSITGTDTLTDFYYWDEQIWTDLINKLLKYTPKKVGVSFFFGKNLGNIQIEPHTRKLFSHPKILWASLTDSEGQGQLPIFSEHTGIVNLSPDYDGTIRRFNPSLLLLPHMGLRLSNKKISDFNFKDQKTVFINYQTLPNTFKSFSLTALMNNEIPEKELKNKTVVIGAKNSPNHILPTPLGFMTKSEIIANIIDNANGNKWPIKLDFSVYILYFLVIIFICILIVFQYPQTLGLAITTAFTGFVVVISAWIFDRYYIWFPIISTITQIISVYVIFVGYKLTQNERKSWALEQERKNLFELEQMKNNFISLFSHDLKTPIAKIQGIADRLLKTSKEESLKSDLSNLKSSSTELQKYIQSILQVTRIESSDFKIKREALDINQIIENVISQLSPLAAEKQIFLNKELEPLFSVEIDGSLIQEVIINLVENAIKYTPSQGSITIQSREVEDGVMIQVKDTGDGISAGELPYVWGKFYRGQKHNLNTKGTGLGLYLVKYFIELHGGKVFIESQEKKGTTVGFKIPFTEGLNT